MYKNMLVAMDGSDTAKKALDEAIRLAGEWQAQLRIVHVVDEVSLNRDAELAGARSLQQEQRETGLKILEQAAATAQQAGVPAETKLLSLDRLVVDLADVIGAEAEAWPADLIVVGSHGRRGVRRLFLGSVAEGVARIAPTPVLLIRGADAAKPAAGTQKE